MKLSAFKKFLDSHFNEDEDIEIYNCIDGGALIMPTFGGEDNTFICVSDDEEEHYYTGQCINQIYGDSV